MWPVWSVAPAHTIAARIKEHMILVVSAFYILYLLVGAYIFKSLEEPNEVIK